MKENLDHFSERMEQMERIKENGLVERNRELTEELLSDLTRDVTSEEVQKTVKKLIELGEQSAPDMDMGENYWEAITEEFLKNQKVIELKEIRLSLNIDTNDFNTKLNQTAKFLAAGHKVKASIRFRGREMAHSALGADVLKRFAEALPQASMDKPPVLEGRTMSILLIPKPNKD